MPIANSTVNHTPAHCQITTHTHTRASRQDGDGVGRMERVQHLRDGIIILDTWPTHVQYTQHLVYIPTYCPYCRSMGHRAQWLFFLPRKASKPAVCACVRACVLCAPAPKVWHLFDFDPAYP